jgi:hypothetical protein
MFILLSACDEIPPPNVPDPPPEDTDLPVTGVELIADPPVELAPPATGPHSDPRLHFDDGALLIAWLAGDTAQLSVLPPLDATLLQPVEVGVGVAAGARPDTGEAEERQIGVWTGPGGAVRAVGLLEGGGLMNEGLEVAAAGALPGSVRLDLAIDGAADLVWSNGTEIVTSGFDRLLTLVEEEVIEEPVGGDAFDAVAAPTTGFVAAWIGTGGDLLVGPIPATAAAVPTATSGATDPNLAVREDGAWAVVWVDGVGALWMATAGAPGSVVDPIALGTNGATPAIAWVADRVSIVWVDGTTLRLGLYEPDGTETTDLVDLGEADGRPALAAREVNGAWEMAVAWPEADGSLNQTFVTSIDRG